MKLGPEGALEWDRYFSPAGADDRGTGYDIERLPSGGYVVAATVPYYPSGFDAGALVAGSDGSIERCEVLQGFILGQTPLVADARDENLRRHGFDVAGQGVSLTTQETTLPDSDECRWCARPGYHGSLRVADEATGTRWSWSPGGATLFDVLRGDLGVLMATGGDFLAAMSQPVSNCLANDTAATEVLETYPDPRTGEAYFYLLRAVKITCPVAGTYDSGSSSQVGARDDEIAAGRWICP